jgi:hypothetical protein
MARALYRLPDASRSFETSPRRSLAGVPDGSLTLAADVTPHDRHIDLLKEALHVGTNLLLENMCLTLRAVPNVIERIHNGAPSKLRVANPQDWSLRAT